MNPPTVDAETVVEPCMPDPSTGVTVRVDRLTGRVLGAGHRGADLHVDDLVVMVDPEGGDDYPVRFRLDGPLAAQLLPHLLDVVTAEASPHYRPDLTALRQLVATHTGWLFDRDGDGGPVEEPF